MSHPGPAAPVALTGIEGRVQALAMRLRHELEGEVRVDPGSRHLYATDASSYRHVPLGVVTPRSVDDVAATLAACRELDLPVLTRGAGTSLAGQATNAAIIVDVSRHLDRICSLDPHARTARVEPGVVLDDLQAAAAPHGLRFGPDPSTHDRCTLGGMIGNDACGVHSLTTGRTLHQVEQLELLLADGTPVTVGRHTLDEARALAARDDRVGRLFADLLALRADLPAQLEGRLAQVPRRVSGFRLEELAHDDHLHVARALVGTEGTCAVITAATVRLVEAVGHTAVVVIPAPSLADAADDAPRLRGLDLPGAGITGLEGLDDRLVAGAARPGRPPSAGLELLPPGGGWLLVEVGGDTAREARAAAEVLAAATGHDARVVTDPAAQRALWKVRADGLGAITFTPGQRPLLGGWEDAAVAPERVGAYLRDLDALLDRHGLTAGVYGHVGDGCVHTRIDFDHTTATGRATFRTFVEQAADLVAAHGGSLSGEHGDGQARGELLARQFGDDLVGLFARFQRVFDPERRLNPHRVVDAAPLDADLRLAELPQMRTEAAWLALPADGGDLASATSRCVGMGVCLRDQGTGTMCPSWMATHEEAHSTRGRARLLFEALRPETDLDGWRDEAVDDALSLCLSCKACKAECPVDVDIAAYKAEFLARRWKGRIRPAQHYALGGVGAWLRAGSRTPRLANAAARSPAADRLRRRLGLTDQRPLPELADEPFSRWWRRRGGALQPAGEPVLLFIDTFTETLSPEVGRAAVAVLEDAGARVHVPPRPVCCGRPLIEQGMLGAARRQLGRLARQLATAAHADVPIVGLEPSCTSALRDELGELRPHDPDAEAVAAVTRTLAEHLDAVDYQPPTIDAEVLQHGHCHHEAVLGTSADQRVLSAAGTRWRDIDAGCCGLAGGFGFRAGDPYEVSVAAGEDRFAPAARQSPDAMMVSDGFSCRTQLDHLVPGARATHLAELLAEALPERW